MKKIYLLILCSLLIAHRLLADEGMWLPCLLGQQKLDDMRKKGLKLSAEDLYSINQSSLKDAIVLFGRGCTGAIVSDEGLLLTNHHCGFGSIQRHSAIDHDYLTDGFWAMNQEEELANPGLLLKPAMFAQVELPVGAKGQVVTVPTSAVIDSGARQIVLIQQGEGRF